MLNRLRWPAALTVAALAVATSWTVRVALADLASRRDDISGLESASRWTPDNAAIWTRLATWIEPEDPARAARILEHAVALNPWDTAARIRLGLRYEAEGNSKRAEQVLLEAAQHDRLYLPRWTMANFYYRRGDEARFWEWAAAASDMVYDDGTALFRLCGSVREDGRLIERIHIRRPEIRAHYLGYLLRAHRFDMLMPAVRTLLADGRGSDVDLLLNASDRLLDRKRLAEAMEIWNGLAQRRLIAFGPLEPGRGRLLTNGRFDAPPTSRVFDWRLGDVAGVTATMEDGLRLTFSGRQPEHCELLAQLVPLPEDADLELTVVYRTADVAPPSGLSWRITDASTGAQIASVENLYSDVGESRRGRFRTAANGGLARLSLRYDRAGGTTRNEGYLTIREVGLRVVPRENSKLRLRFFGAWADL